MKIVTFTLIITLIAAALAKELDISLHSQTIHTQSEHTVEKKKTARGENTGTCGDDIEWVFEDGSFSDDGIYPSGTSAISLVAYNSEYSDEEFEYEFYYSPDSMFSDRELQADVYSGVATCVEEGDGYAYHFDYTGDVQPGYYIITISLKGAKNRTIISVCLVE